MRFHSTPRPLLQLITAILLTPTLVTSKPYPKGSSPARGGLSFNNLFGRTECSGQLCGWDDQLCCEAGSACYTDSNSQAQCSSTGYVAATTAAGAGYYSYYTTTFYETDTVLSTAVMSTWVGEATTTAYVAPAATTAISCNYALNESPCGSICCASGQYCAVSGQCSAAAAGSSGYYSSVYSSSYNTASAPLRATSNTVAIVTASVTPTTTIPFETPVATGANVTLTQSEANTSGGLSGGAIAGIVIGVILGVALLLLICFYCCLRGLLDGCLAIFGLGGRRRRRETEVDVYERRSHRSSGGGGRTWYGASRPARVERREERRTEGGGANWLGIGAGLAGLAAVLGLKRRHDRRRQEEKSEYSYESDYYTSASKFRHAPRDLTLTDNFSQVAQAQTTEEHGDRHGEDSLHEKRIWRLGWMHGMALFSQRCLLQVAACTETDDEVHIYHSANEVACSFDGYLVSDGDRPQPYPESAQLVFCQRLCPCVNILTYVWRSDVHM